MRLHGRRRSRVTEAILCRATEKPSPYRGASEHDTVSLTQPADAHTSSVCAPPADILTSPTPVDNSPASFPCSTPHTPASSQARRVQETSESARWAFLALRASLPPSAGKDADTRAW